MRDDAWRGLDVALRTHSGDNITLTLSADIQGWPVH